MCQHICLISGKCDCEQIFCLSVRARHTEAIDQEWDKEADQTWEDSEELPKEGTPDQCQLVLVLSEQVVVRDVVLKIECLLVVDVVLWGLFKGFALFQLQFVQEIAAMEDFRRMNHGCILVKQESPTHLPHSYDKIVCQPESGIDWL